MTIQKYVFDQFLPKEEAGPDGNPVSVGALQEDEFLPVSGMPAQVASQIMYVQYLEGELGTVDTWADKLNGMTMPADVANQIDIAVTKATAGMYTQDQVNAAVAAATQDTYDQAELDAAVAKATKGMHSQADLDAAVAKATKGMHSQADLDAAVAKATKGTVVVDPALVPQIEALLASLKGVTSATAPASVQPAKRIMPSWLSSAKKQN